MPGAAAGALIFLMLLAGAVVMVALLGRSIPTSFLPDEDQGYVFAGLQLPDAASLQRTESVVDQAEEILKNTPGIQYYTSVIGYSMLSGVNNTYSAFFFITLKNWSERKKLEEQYTAIKEHLNREFAKIPGAVGFAFPPPAIPGVGTSGGVTGIGASCDSSASSAPGSCPSNTPSRCMACFSDASSAGRRSHARDVIAIRRRRPDPRDRPPPSR